MDMPRMSPPVEGGTGPVKRKPNYLLIFFLIGLGSCIIFMVIAASVIVPSVRRAADVRSSRRCLARLQNLSQGMLAYARDHDGKLPASFNYQDLRRRSQPYGIRCPKTGQPFIYNEALAGRKLSDIEGAEETVLFHETPQAGQPHTHSEEDNVGLVSGTSKAIKDKKEVRWEPQMKG